jgi:phage terminase small subunit
MKKSFTDKQKRFVDEYLIDLNATAAAGRAGYKDPNKGRQLVTKSNIAALIEKRQADRMKRTEITQEYVLNSLKSVADRCMGERLDSSGANKSLELLGKHLKLFTDVKEIKLDVSKLSDEELISLAISGG